MRLYRHIYVAFLCLAAAFAQGPPATQNPTRDSSSAQMQAPLATRGIIVGTPKVYDNYYLQQLLNTLRTRLETLQVVDQATLLSHIGQTQGANLQRLGGSIQGTGPSTPTVSTGSPTSATPGATTTTTPLAPSNPAPAPTTLTLPSIGQSSLDTLNESMQLAYEITNVELLLNGAISDQVQADTGRQRATFTVGFPITIRPPEKSDGKLSDSIAEVQVTICGSPEASIVTLLPKERTYNVASILDNSFAASLGTVIGGVFSVGGGFLWQHQQYYLVQQQETVALQYASGGCEGTATSNSAFAWQIHPVLGKHFVRPGMETNFVQVSIPDPIEPPGGTLVRACVRAGWRKTSDNGNRLKPLSSDAAQCFNIRYYSTLPKVDALKVRDVGSGNVFVQATGTFLDGTRVRIGSKPSASTYISSDQRTLGFYSAASDMVAAGGATILSREDDEDPLLLPLSGVSSALSTAQPLRINSVSVMPYSDSQSLVTIKFSPPSGATLPPEPCPAIPGAVNPPPCVPTDPWVVNIGDKVFGLADAPFFSSNANEIKLLVPSALITAAPKLQMRRILWPEQYYYAEYPLDKSALLLTKVTLLSPAPQLTLALSGVNLDHALLEYPECSTCLKTLAPTLATVSFSADKKVPGIDVDAIKALKQIVLCRSDSTSTRCDSSFAPILAEVPKDDSAAPKDTKPKLEKHDPVKPGTAQVSITGTGLDQIVSIKAGPTSVAFRLSVAEKPVLIITVPSTITGVEGEYPLLIELSDKSTMSYLLTISSKAK